MACALCRGSPGGLQGARWTTLPRLQRSLHHASAQLHDPPMEGAVSTDAAPSPPSPAAGQLLTDPPATVPWSSASVSGTNHVKMVGVVLRGVTTRFLAKLNQPVSTCPIGLRPPYWSSTLPQASLGSITVEGFGYQALQMGQHLHKGMTIAVEGHLRLDRWRDQESGQMRQMHKVVLGELQIVESSPLEHEAAETRGQDEHWDTAAQEGANLAGGAPAASQLPRATKPPASTPSSSFSHRMFQEEGLSFAQIAAQREIKMSTVLHHVLVEAALGRPLDWQRAASELQVGPPGSPWLTLPEVVSAVHAVQQETPEVPVVQLPLGKIREELEKPVMTAVKVQALEQLSPDRTLTYGVIRLGVAVAAHGLDPLEPVSHAPVAPAPSAGPPPF